MGKLGVTFWVACAALGCSKAPSKSDCDKFADMEVKCVGDAKPSDKAQLDEARAVFKSVCAVKPDPTAADLKDTTSPEAKEIAASRAEITAKKACAVKTDDCAEYKKCQTASGLK